jgi:hypothetical protein
MLPQLVFLRLTILFYRSQRIWERKEKITGETLIRKNRSLRAYGLRETPYIYKYTKRLKKFPYFQIYYKISGILSLYLEKKLLEFFHS